MAKKATKSTAVATLEQFTINGSLDVSDVLSVVTSRAEERYSREIARCRAEVAALDATNTSLRDTIKKQVLKEAVVPHSDNVKALRAAAKLFGGVVSVTVTETYHGRIIPVNDEGDLMVAVQVKAKSGSYHNACFNVATKPSKELLALGKQITDNEAKIAVINTEALSWRRKLSNVPMLERQYRAKIASAKLQTSEDGQRLLSMLTDDLDEAILALPSC